MILLIKIIYLSYLFMSCNIVSKIYSYKDICIFLFTNEIYIEI